MAADIKHWRYFNCLGSAVLAACCLATTSGAFGVTHADVTIQVVDSEDYAEETLVSEIKLPDIASPKARENAAPGLETANEVRRSSREFGLERSAEARELGREARRVKPTPSVPEMPPTPEKPDVPEIIPVVPQRPDIPAIPDVPGSPNLPDTPDIPGSPDLPDTPDVPENPDLPEVPEVPDVPGIP